MSTNVRLPVGTASAKQSIWLGLGENQFRTHVVGLESASNEVPGDPKVHSLQDWERGHAHPGHRLPLRVEQRIADDIAFIAAAEEGVAAVAAASLEELVDGQGLRFRLAMNAGVPTKTREVLRLVFDTLATCASRGEYQSLLQPKTQPTDNRAPGSRSHRVTFLLHHQSMRRAYTLPIAINSLAAAILPRRSSQ